MFIHFIKDKFSCNVQILTDGQLVLKPFSYDTNQRRKKQSVCAS